MELQACGAVGRAVWARTQRLTGELRAAGINVEQTENVVFAGAQAACARIQLDKEPDAGVLERIRVGCDDILSLSLTGI